MERNKTHESQEKSWRSEKQDLDNQQTIKKSPSKDEPLTMQVREFSRMRAFSRPRPRKHSFKACAAIRWSLHLSCEFVDWHRKCQHQVHCRPYRWVNFPFTWLLGFLSINWSTACDRDERRRLLLPIWMSRSTSSTERSTRSTNITWPLPYPSTGSSFLLLFSKSNTLPE